MCDSHISESCPRDFTTYCPVDSLSSESRAAQRHKTHTKSHITWFSRKSKGASASSRPCKEETRQLLQDYSVSDKYGAYSYNGATNSPDHVALDSSDDERWEVPRTKNRSLEKASPYVSQEELDALKGCVMRRRAVFSPSPSSSPVHSYVHQRPAQQPSPKTASSLPCAGKHVLEEVSHTRQGSLEYDHLMDFDPYVPAATTADSVSVQFHLQAGDESGGTGSGVWTVSSQDPPSGQRQPVSTYSAPRRPDCDSHRLFDSKHECRQVPSGFQSKYDSPKSSASCDVLLADELDSRDTDNCSHKQPSAAEASGITTKIFPPLLDKSKTIQQQQSPFHAKFNSPLLVRHPYEGSLKTCDTGSNYSLYSQTTTISSLADRQHCSYSKGVDGTLFKDRTEQISIWFSEFSDQQRNMMLLKLLEQCDCAQMHFLSVQMEPVLHEGCPHNCQDLLSWLPFNLVIHIFSFLDPVSLCQASLVSKDWYHAATQPSLWKTLCKLEKWKLSVLGELKYQSRCLNSDGSIRWKSLFAEKFRLRRNWLKGYCTVRTFEGHTQGISCIQFDDTRIVSGSWDKTIKVWNRRTNTVWAALTLAGHSGTVRCLHLHQNRLVSGSSDRTIKVWDLATDKVGWVGAACRATMVGHMHTVRCLQADDEKVISGSYDQTLKIWDIKTGRCQQTLRGHNDAVLCLQFDTHKVVSGSKDKTIKIWSLPDGLCKLTFHGHQAAVSCLHFDETRIISGALDRLIKIWNLMTGECIRTIDWIKSEGHTGVIRHLQADSWKIISAADDKTLKVWNVHTGNRLLTLKSHTDGVTCLQFNDEVIVSGSYDKTVKLWDFSSC